MHNGSHWQCFTSQLLFTNYFRNETNAQPDGEILCDIGDIALSVYREDFNSNDPLFPLKGDNQTAGSGDVVVGYRLESILENNWGVLCLDQNPSQSFEGVSILGYDATDGDSTQFHNRSTPSGLVTGNSTLNGLKEGEYVAVYLRNDGLNKVIFNEVRLGGDIYTYQDFEGQSLPDWNSILNSEGYTLVIEATSSGTITLDSTTPEIQPGQYMTIILSLSADWNVGQSVQFMITSSNGAIFVDTITMGSQIG
jgi:hypothetical protein